jgi:hypothetical protein
MYQQKLNHIIMDTQVFNHHFHPESMRNISASLFAAAAAFFLTQPSVSVPQSVQFLFLAYDIQSSDIQFASLFFLLVLYLQFKSN